MHLDVPKIDITERASFYRVSERTAYRWQRAGLDLMDAKAVALHILDQKNPSPEAIEAILESLEN